MAIPNLLTRTFPPERLSHHLSLRFRYLDPRIAHDHRIRQYTLIQRLLPTTSIYILRRPSTLIPPTRTHPFFLPRSRNDGFFLFRDFTHRFWQIPNLLLSRSPSPNSKTVQPDHRAAPVVLGRSEVERRRTEMVGIPKWTFVFVFEQKDLEVVEAGWE